ncbi:MAG: NADH:flavin oxidoreductase/NADH oxidase [Acidobacteriaceae bacterium]|nr:NADH:flavin oxidoreductase/NADH oxidase [Acidobacteriaceae bacterium]
MPRNTPGSTRVATEPIFTPYQLGTLTLPNRIVMSPMTRARTTSEGRVPLPIEAVYYAQRASAGLILTGGIYVSRQAVGSINVPGLYTAEQVEGWKAVTSAVHTMGGRIFAQLGHSGSVSHPDLLDGAMPTGPSPINPLQKMFTPIGMKDTITPRALTNTEIKEIVKDYGTAAKNAKEAGFDGVELHGANTYLIPQFLNLALNRRTDEYGGSPENRARFLFEVLEEIATVWDKNRIGVKLSPTLHGVGAFVASEESLPTYHHIAERLNAFTPAYLHLLRAINDVSNSPLAVLQANALQHYRSIFIGTIIGNGGFDQAQANATLKEDDADLISFARLFISNPDLVERFSDGSPLSPSDPQTYYRGGQEGFTDYPRRVASGLS